MKSKFDLIEPLVAKTAKVLWVLGQHAFVLVLFLILLSLVWGTVISYKYVYLAEKETPRVTQNIIKFNVGLYQSVLNELAER